MQTINKHNYNNTVYKEKDILINTIYNDCTFVETDFINIKAKNVIFRRCNLISTFFSSASLTEITFIECNLRMANFAKVKFNRCLFKGCSFDGANFYSASGLGACVIPVGNKYVHSIKGATTSFSPILGWLIFPNFVPEKHKNITIDEEEQADTEWLPLPPVDHYRSPPTPFKRVIPVNNYYYKQEEDKYGYKEVAILECKNIKEFETVKNEKNKREKI